MCSVPCVIVIAVVVRIFLVFCISAWSEANYCVARNITMESVKKYMSRKLRLVKRKGIFNFRRFLGSSQFYN